MTATRIKIQIHVPSPPPALLSALDRAALRYTNPVYLYHCLWLGGTSCCGVFGDGENGAYEWFVWRGETLQTSDVGYGDIEVALRNVLNKTAGEF
jgi:hypothetical protein